MKKSIAILLIIMTLFFICSCKPQAEVDEAEVSELAPIKESASTATPKPSPVPTPKAYNKDAFIEHEDGGLEYIYPDKNEITISEEIPVSDLSPINDIPIYEPNKITTGSLRGFIPTIDHGMWLSWSNYTDYLQYILTVYPSSAWRRMENNRYYVMYDITDGTRIYVFFASLDNDARVLGYPILMNSSLSYNDFSKIKIGDTLDDVRSIDYIAKYTNDIWDPGTEQGISNYTNAGNPICSVHLLTDGILKYTYERSGEEGNYVYTIVDIEYHEDFKMEGLGGVTDYSIAEVDYVD